MRTTGFDKNIDEVTFTELRSLDCSYGFGKDWKTEKIPEIKEVFSILPHKKDIFIENNILEDLEKLNSLDKQSKEYSELYNDVIQVGEYPIEK